MKIYEPFITKFMQSLNPWIQSMENKYIKTFDILINFRYFPVFKLLAQNLLSVKVFSIDNLTW